MFNGCVKTNATFPSFGSISIIPNPITAMPAPDNAVADAADFIIVRSMLEEDDDVEIDIVRFHRYYNNQFVQGIQ